MIPQAFGRDNTIRQDAQELKAGDSIDFNYGKTHQMENVGPGAAKVLCVAVPWAL